MKGILLCITITVSIIAITSSFDFNNWDYKNVVVNPYRVLGISPFSSMNKIKKRYRELVKKYHPDKNPGDKSAEEKFKEISEAYEVLKDDKKKAMYDQYGHAAFEGGMGGAHYQSGGFQDPFDLFRDFYCLKFFLLFEIVLVTEIYFLVYRHFYYL